MNCQSSRNIHCALVTSSARGLEESSHPLGMFASTSTKHTGHGLA